VRSKGKSSKFLGSVFWWAGPDLNRRPQPRKGCFRLALQRQAS